MPIPGNTEPGAVSGKLDVQQQQSSIQFSSPVPIKKRRFPIIQRSPSPEEKASDSDAIDPKNKQELSIPDGKLSLNDEKNTAPAGNSDVSKISALLVKREVVTPTNIEMGQSNPEFLASKPHDVKHPFSLGSIGDSRNKRDVMPNEKQTEPAIPESSTIAQTESVKQEIISAQVQNAPRLELSMSSMNVGLSLGLKKPSFPVRSEKLDPTVLSLASSKENHVLHGKNGNTTETVSSGASANRSNWDLNTTMDVWEGSAIGNAFARQHVRSEDFGKSNRFNDAKLALATGGTVDHSLNKGKHVLDDPKSNSLSVSTQSDQLYKTDDSLGLKLAMPSRELIANMEGPLSDKLISTRVNVNVNRSVKSEPADDNSKHDLSIGSSSSNIMGLSNFSSVKREPANNPSLETVMPMSASVGKLVDHGSVKFETVESNQEAGKGKDTMLPEFVARIMQHQDSCASSSSLPVQSMPDNSCHSMMPNCSDLTNTDDLSNQSGHTFHNKESHDRCDKSDGQIAGMVSKPISEYANHSTLCTLGSSNLEALNESELAHIDEHTIESCQPGDVAVNDEEKINIPAEILEEAPFGSDSESQEMDIDEDNATNKEYDEYEDGEVREHSQHSTGENPVVEREGAEDSFVENNSRSPRHPIPLGVENINVKKNHDETSSDMIKDCVSVSYETNSEDCSSQRVSNNKAELKVDVKSISTALEKKVVKKIPGKEVSGNMSIKGSQGMKVAPADEASQKTIKEICSGDNDSTLSKEEASLNDHDAAKDSNNIGNKTRIINLSRTSGVTTPTKTRPILNRLPASQSGKDDPDLDGDVQPRANRDEFYTGGSKKFVKDRVHDRTFRYSNSFMRGKGRMSGRFGSLRREWDSAHDFISENYRGQSDYRAIRRKHTSSVPNVDVECDGYGVPPHDGNAMGNIRRKEMNDEFSSLRRTSLRRISPGDRGGMDTRGIQMMHRIPRNMSPGHCPDDNCSDMMGIRHGNKFMRPFSDMIDPVYGRQQVVYDELDGQLLHGNRNFRNGYPRIGSKSPVRSRSPGPWLSPRRRSSNGPPETSFRMGRMRSPEHGSFCDEMMPRRRGSPSYRNVDSGRDHTTHHRPANSHRRSPPARGFPRNGRRLDMLNSQEMEVGSNEYMNGPLHTYKFHGDGGSDDRRNFMERRGPPIRPFRPMYGGDNDFQFHQNDGPPRPYRFCPPGVDNEFVERSGNMRGREFDGRVKHQPMARRIRNIDEQTTMEQRAWHDDGYSDARMKRMRF